MTKAKILFVDDEEHIVSTLKSLFRNSFEVYTATSGAQALEIVKRTPIHVIVSDQRMPGMQGIELLREVRRLSPNTMRIMLTGYADLAAIVGSINEGEIYRHLYKPWNNKSVLATVSAAADAALALADEMSDTVLDQAELVQTGILVIDDNLESSIAVKSLFADKYPVFTAASCTQALPTAPEAPMTKTLSPATTRALRKKCSAVVPPNNMLEASSNDSVAGINAMAFLTDTARYWAWHRIAAPGKATTASPGLNEVTFFPTDCTIPARSVPMMG